MSFAHFIIGFAFAFAVGLFVWFVVLPSIRRPTRKERRAILAVRDRKEKE